MKNSTVAPTKEQYNTYQSMYDYFNAKLFKNELPNCILNFSRKNKKSAGHFSFERWENRDGVKTHEININPLHLYRDSDMEVAQTLVHEMCHLWQFVFGKPSRKGYHNKEFAFKMKAVGLMPSSTGQEGGKETGQNMSDYPIEDGVFMKAFNKMPKKLLFPFKSNEAHVSGGGVSAGGGAGGSESESTEATTKKGKVKYTCGGCASNVWGQSGKKIVCFDCEQENPAIEKRTMQEN